MRFLRILSSLLLPLVIISNDVSVHNRTDTSLSLPVFEEQAIIGRLRIARFLDRRFYFEPMTSEIRLLRRWYHVREEWELAMERIRWHLAFFHKNDAVVRAQLQTLVYSQPETRGNFLDTLDWQKNTLLLRLLALDVAIKSRLSHFFWTRKWAYHALRIWPEEIIDWAVVAWFFTWVHFDMMVKGVIEPGDIWPRIERGMGDDFVTENYPSFNHLSHILTDSLRRAIENRHKDALLELLSDAGPLTQWVVHYHEGIKRWHYKEDEESVHNHFFGKPYFGYGTPHKISSRIMGWKRWRALYKWLSADEDFRRQVEPLFDRIFYGIPFDLMPKLSGAA